MPFGTPLKLSALMMLTTHLEGISWPGVQESFVGRVHRGRPQYGAETMIPALSLLEPADQVLGPQAGENGVLRKEPWLILVQGWATDDHNNPTDPAYYLAALVTQRLSRLVAVDAQGDPVDPEVHMLKGHSVDSIIIGAAICRPPTENVSAKAFFYLPLTVTIGVDIREPFAPVG